MSQMALLPYVVNTFQALNIYDQLTEPMIVPEEPESPWQFNEDAFNVNLDVQHFKPNELNVKIMNNFIYVEGKHEEDEDDHGYIARHFIRRYELPSDVDLKHVECNYSTDGILTIYVPKKTNERKLPIFLTPYLAVRSAEWEPSISMSAVEAAIPGSSCSLS